MSPLKHDFLVARTQLQLDGADARLAPVLAYIADLERQLTEEDAGILRLRKIEEAAEKAVWYHYKGRDPDFSFDANHMIYLMDELDATL